jgi:putative ABC transport system permease protein
MRFFDLVVLIFQNLGRRKGRVALTAVGVVIGTAAVVVLVSLAIGLQRNAQEQLVGIGDLTQIYVSPNYGEISSKPVSGSAQGDSTPIQTVITSQSLADFSALPGVAAVVPRDWLQAGMVMKLDRLEGYSNVYGVGTDDLSNLALEAQTGVTEIGKGKIVVGALVSRNFYDPKLRPGQEAPAPPELQGQTLKLVFTKWMQDGTEVRKTIPFEVVGVLKETSTEPDWTVYMSLDEVTAINEWVTGRRINRNRDGYNMAIVKVDDVSNVLDVAEQITAMGYMASSAQSFVQGINSFYLVLQIIFGGVGAIALLVAAIGIANTMAMAILERTREIGLMKAVGATNRDVLSIFLGEAAGIGLIGGLGGILVGWSAGQIINVLALAYLAAQAAETGGIPPSGAVYTPLWLPVSALIFSIIVGLVSGLYPALRAATLIPVNALKYE